jgi:hypothetical protein
MLVTVFTTLIGFSIVVGHGQPPSLAVQQLHLLDCALPCWMGIVLGQASADEALHRFNETFALSENFLLRASAPNPSSAVWVELPLPDANSSVSRALVQFGFIEGTINRVMIENYADVETQAMPSLGDIFSLLGVPSCVAPWDELSAVWSLYYDIPDGVIAISLLRTRSNRWTQPIYVLDMRVNYLTLDDEICDSPFNYTWRGLHRSHYS